MTEVDDDDGSTDDSSEDSDSDLDSDGSKEEEEHPSPLVQPVITDKSEEEQRDDDTVDSGKISFNDSLVSSHVDGGGGDNNPSGAPTSSPTKTVSFALDKKILPLTHQTAHDTTKEVKDEHSRPSAVRVAHDDEEVSVASAASSLTTVKDQSKSEITNSSAVSNTRKQQDSSASSSMSVVAMYRKRQGMKKDNKKKRKQKSGDGADSSNDDIIDAEGFIRSDPTALNILTGGKWTVPSLDSTWIAVYDPEEPEKLSFGR